MLNSLAPLLRKLEQGLRAWLGASHSFKLPAEKHASLAALADDLRRQIDDMGKEQPLLTIMLMGGTGVGKSTLLNALAGGNIAAASFQRPTTRDPVVYYHEAVKPDRFDPLLHHTCRLTTHDRPALFNKIIVDTPDVDSNDLENREKLMRLLPVADIVLFVGSQEKYHDKVIWEVFLEQRKRRAFAFVMNKWDRCLHTGAQGMRPDEDLLKDLKNEGFQNPQLFRTCAQYWVDRVAGDGKVETPPGEQFTELVSWLEMGLNALEIQAIKARGIGQLLEQLEKELDAAAPPDLTNVAQRTRQAWASVLGDEAHATSDVLLNTLEPYHKDIEHHFTVESHRQFKDLMAGYLTVVTKFKYMGATLRDQVPFMPRSKDAIVRPDKWDLARFTQACSVVAGERHLDARSKALADRLLVEASNQDFPLDVISQPVEDAAKIDWRLQYSQALIEVLSSVEETWSRPTGIRRLVRGLVVFIGNWLPRLALFGGCAILLWQIFMVEKKIPDLSTLFALLAVVLITMVLCHFLIMVVMPLRWPRIRSDFQRLLEKRLESDLAAGFAQIPLDRAAALLAERKKVQQILDLVRETKSWLQNRQEAATVSGLYGN